MLQHFVLLVQSTCWLQCNWRWVTFIFRTLSFANDITNRAVCLLFPVKQTCICFVVFRSDRLYFSMLYPTMTALG